MRTEMRCYGKEKHLGDTVEMEMKCNDFIRFEMEKTVVEEKEVDQIWIYLTRPNPKKRITG